VWLDLKGRGRTRAQILAGGCKRSGTFARLSASTKMDVMDRAEADAAATAPTGDLDALFRAEGDGLFRTLVAFTGGRADIAEEATAEAFARAIAQQETLRDPLAWIYRVAFCVAIDEVRRDARHAPASDEASVVAPELHGVMDALKELSPNQRAAILLHHVNGLDTAEVADRMGIARSTVRVHLYRARKRLAALLGDEEVD
jgi:RNA polymerase sigma-70 factor, ECF subfamily